MGSFGLDTRRIKYTRNDATRHDIRIYTINLAITT